MKNRISQANLSPRHLEILEMAKRNGFLSTDELSRLLQVTVQTVRRDQNELYYDLIKAFGERTGIPVILNTSFNENEPIVHTPEQAIACFARTKMDALALGPYWYEKPADLAAKAQVIGER